MLRCFLKKSMDLDLNGFGVWYSCFVLIPCMLLGVGSQLAKSEIHAWIRELNSSVRSVGFSWRKWRQRARFIQQLVGNLALLPVNLEVISLHWDQADHHGKTHSLFVFITGGFVASWAGEIPIWTFVQQICYWIGIRWWCFQPRAMQ